MKSNEMYINNQYGMELEFKDLSEDEYTTYGNEKEYYQYIDRIERISNIIMNLDTKYLSYIMTHGKDNEKIEYLFNLVGRMLLEKAI